MSIDYSKFPFTDLSLPELFILARDSKNIGDNDFLKACMDEITKRANQKKKDAADHLETLRKFVLDLFSEIDWLEGGDLDGFQFQDLCEKHGILLPEKRFEDCGEGCNCAAMDNIDKENGFTCYRMADWIRLVPGGEGEPPMP